jgi:hypothetical protein
MLIADSDSVNLGSNPSPPANQAFSEFISPHQYLTKPAHPGSGTCRRYTLAYLIPGEAVCASIRTGLN